MKAWRLEGEAILEYLSKADETEDNNSYTRADMRSMLDQLRDRQSMPVWSLSKDEAYPPAPYVEDEEEDQVISRPDRANDGGYDEHTMDIDHVASEALEKGSVEKAAEKAEAQKQPTQPTQSKLQSVVSKAARRLSGGADKAVPSETYSLGGKVVFFPGKTSGRWKDGKWESGV